MVAWPSGMKSHFLGYRKLGCRFKSRRGYFQFFFVVVLNYFVFFHRILTVWLVSVYSHCWHFLASRDFCDKRVSSLVLLLFLQLASHSSRESVALCDICEQNVQNLSRHMRNCHPGCGGNCSRHGYRSDGVYTDGWFGGICGTGHPYYLLCPECHNRHMAKAQEARTLAAFKATKL